jgi:hypothetical protein
MRDFVATRCASCNVQRPMRTSPCSRCGTCALFRDHHCPWFDSCIALHNLSAFVAFLGLGAFLSLYCITLNAAVVFSGDAALEHAFGVALLGMLQAAAHLAFCISLLGALGRSAALNLLIVEEMKLRWKAETLKAKAAAADRTQPTRPHARSFAVVANSDSAAVTMTDPVELAYLEARLERDLGRTVWQRLRSFYDDYCVLAQAYRVGYVPWAIASASPRFTAPSNAQAEP